MGVRMADLEQILKILKRYDIEPDILGETGDHSVTLSPAEIINNRLNEFNINGELSSLIKSKDRICFILNDRNRPTPTHLVMEYLFDRYPDLENKTESIVIATGTHKEPTDIEISEILGDEYLCLKHKVHIHRSREYGQHEYFGQTKRGTQLYFDRCCLENDLLIMINSVEPHYFAGFTGGRKSILPGISSYETIEKNHSYSLHPLSRTLQLEGNPVHEDMVEACDIFLNKRDHLSIQLIQAPGVLLTDVRVGDIKTSFKGSVDVAKHNFCLPIKKKYDIVISNVKEPMDKTLYQSQKAIENGKLALKDGGILLLISSMHEGIGQEKFWDLLTMSDDVDIILQRIEEGYELGFHKAAKIIQIVKKADILVVSKIDPDILDKGFIHGFNTIGQAVERAIEKFGYGPDTLLIHDGSVSVPMYEGE